METDAIHGISKIGSSLPVPNVQELASTNFKGILHRYIRPEIMCDEVSVHQSDQIPVIDMSKLAADNVGYQTEMEKLHRACKEWGFFQLTDHGATTTIEKMKMDTQEFFKLPLEEKMVYAQQPNGLQGYGQAFVVSDDQKLDWADLLAIFAMPVSERNMKFWPDTPTSFRSTLEEYSLEIYNIFIRLYELMATNLGVKFQKFLDLNPEHAQTLRMNYYPPCSEADKVIGITPHYDSSTLTLLVQVGDVEGLQIRNNGKWIPIKPIPGAIVVNIGYALEMMSNGEYRSIEHRAVVDFKKERLSIATFQLPSTKSIIGPLSDFVKENGAKYKTLTSEEYMKQYFGSKKRGQSFLDSLRISN